MLYWVLLIGSLAIAYTNWRLDSTQRTGTHLSIYAMRLVSAGMWYLGTLWKLPLPISAGFKFWLENTVKYSSFDAHASIMQVFLDHIALVQPLVYLLETALAVSLMLGIAVRLAGIVGVLFILNLLIGLYNDPTEWPWTYVGIICAHGMFAVAQAGRSLGIDNLLATRLIPGLPYEGILARAIAVTSKDERGSVFPRAPGGRRGRGPAVRSPGVPNPLRLWPRLGQLLDAGRRSAEVSLSRPSPGGTDLA